MSVAEEADGMPVGRALEVVRRRMEAIRSAGGEVVSIPESASSMRSAEARIDGERRRRRWESVMPRKFWRAQLADIDPRPRQAIAEWADTCDGRNLVVVGPVGSGKTHAAAAAVRSLFFDAAEPASVMFASAVAMLDGLRPDGGHSIEHYVAPEFLVLDDVGSERPTDWTAERLFAVVNARWQDDLPVVATSNLGMAALSDALDPRTFSRLVMGAVVVSLQGEDRRAGR